MSRIIVKIRGKRIKFDSSKTFFNISYRTFCTSFRKLPEIFAEDLIIFLVKVSVGTDSFINHTTHEVIYRLLASFSDNIPTCDLKPTKNTLSRKIRMRLTM